MMRVLAWKEFREGWSIWLSLALLGTAAVFVTPVFLDLLGQTDQRQQQTAVLIALVVLAVTYGVVTGSLLLAGERESRTLVFLDALTARRSGLWWSKVLLGLAFTYAQGVALTVPFVLWAPRAEPTLEAWKFWLLPALTLEATAWGLFSSSFGRNVLGSAGVGGLLYVLSWMITFAVTAVATALTRRNLSGGLVLRVLLDGFALVRSYRIFCWPDQQRAHPMAEGELRTVDWKPDNLQSAIPYPQQSDSRTRGGWLTLAWLAWRQGRSEVAVLVPALLVLGLAGAPFMIGSWSIWTLLVGVVFGTGVWRPEQVEGSYRFLICQRFPPGRVWLVKTLFGLGAAGLVVAAGVLGIAGHLPLLKAVGAAKADASVKDFGLEMITLFGNAKVVAALWLLHGFAVGQLFTLLCPKNLVAVMMSLPVSAGLVGMWLPSLLTGGLPVWQVFVIPVLLLVAGRLVFWAWAAERLATRGPAVSLAACGLLAALWLIGCLTWRVLEVPDVDEPFDVESFHASVRSSTASEASNLILRAMDKLRAKHVELGPAPMDERTVVRQGWASASEEFRDWLYWMFPDKDSWEKDLKEGVKKRLGVVVDPLRMDYLSPLGNVQACREAARLYRLRALQLQAQRKSRAALDHLNDLLRLSRHLRNKTITASFLLGLEVEDEALSGLEDWARGACDDQKLMGDALEALKTHESELPPVDDVVKAHYLGAYPRLRNHYEGLSSPRGWEQPSVAAQMQGNMFLLSQETPWEQARAKRLIKIQYADAFADQPSEPSLERRHPWLRVTGPGDWEQTRLAAKRGLCRVRAVRLGLALLWYEREKKKPARSLAELVPTYLAVLPADPFTRQGFRYRLSRGETIPVVGTAEETALEVAEGQGVLWSTGPDRNDEGGRVQGLNADRSLTEKDVDWIFLVPQVRRR